MRGRYTIRSDTTEGCCFMFLFMHRQQLLSIPFPRAQPRFAVHRPGQPLYLQNGPVRLQPLCDEYPRSQGSAQVSSLACAPISDTFTPG